RSPPPHPSTRWSARSSSAWPPRHRIRNVAGTYATERPLGRSFCLWGKGPRHPLRQRIDRLDLVDQPLAVNGNENEPVRPGLIARLELRCHGNATIIQPFHVLDLDDLERDGWRFAFH